MSRLLTEDELAIHNYHGGEVLSKGRGVQKMALKRNPTFQAIAAQADLQWPVATARDSYTKTLKDALNGKC